MSGLLLIAFILLLLSIGGFGWGTWYINNHPFGGLASMFGSPDPAYNAAQISIVVGIFIFIVGLVLLIVSLVRKGPNKG